MRPSVFGHPLRSNVPAHTSSFEKQWLRSMEEYDQKTAMLQTKTSAYYNRSAKSLLPLRPGDKVRIQNFRDSLWDQVGIVIEAGLNRDYTIRLPSGRTLWRNRRFLTKIPEKEISGKESVERKKKSTPLRRSKRFRCKPDRYQAAQER